MTDVYQTISEQITNMSKSQRKIAKFILNNTDAVPFYTVGKMASKAGVSEATVVRFAVFLGYRGYPELQHALQDTIKNQLTTVDRLKLAEDVYDEERQAVYEMFTDEMERIRLTAEQLDLDAFHQAVDLIVNADRIFIVANRSAVSLGAFLEFYLDLIFENTELIRNPHGISEKLFRIGEEDVVIGLSFSRYTKNTVEAIGFAKKRGAKIIAITDHMLSPLIPSADVSLCAKSEMPSFIDSFVAPLSLINALIVVIGKKRRKEIEGHLSELEEVWEHFGIFSLD